jgi:hypothetical protein
MDPTSILALIGDLSFPRFCGSEGERRAQDLIAARLAEFGVTAERQAFTGEWVTPVAAAVTVGGESRPLFPVEELMQWQGEWAPPAELDACGVLWPAEELSSAPQDEALIAVQVAAEPEACALTGPAAQLLLFDELPAAHAYALSVHPPALPAYVSPADREWILSHLRERAHMSWRAHTETRPFHNLRAEVPGVGPGAVLVGAHLDSFPGTPGSSDDAFGCALLVELARWYAANPPRRTLRLWWFTGEEVDRRGSRAAAEFERAQSSPASILINVDGGVTREHGDPLSVRVTGGDTVAWAQRALAHLSPPVEVREVETHAADTQSFCEAGFATAFPTARRTTPGPYPHLPSDNPATLSADLIARLSEITLALVEEAAL